MKRKGIMLLFSLIPLGGCGQDLSADNTVLCNPVTFEAFFSRSGTGKISYISRAENADGLCRHALKGGKA